MDNHRQCGLLGHQRLGGAGQWQHQQCGDQRFANGASLGTRTAHVWPSRRWRCQRVQPRVRGAQRHSSRRPRLLGKEHFRPGHRPRDATSRRAAGQLWWVLHLCAAQRQHHCLLGPERSGAVGHRQQDRRLCRSKSEGKWAVTSIGSGLRPSVRLCTPQQWWQRLLLGLQCIWHARHRLNG